LTHDYDNRDCVRKAGILLVFGRQTQGNCRQREGSRNSHQYMQLAGGFYVLRLQLDEPPHWEFPTPICKQGEQEYG